MSATIGGSRRALPSGGGMFGRPSTGSERERHIQERFQMMMNELLLRDENKFCADCESKGAPSKLFLNPHPYYAFLAGHATPLTSQLGLLYLLLLLM